MQRALVQCFCTMEAGLCHLALPHHLHPCFPPMDSFPPFSFFSGGIIELYRLFFIIPSSSATTSVSLEVKSTPFQLGALIFHFLIFFIGFSTREGTRSWSTHLASSPVHGLLLFSWRFIEIA